MANSDRRRRTRRAAWTVGILLAAFLGWRIVAHGVGDLLAAVEPATASAWDRRHPVALGVLAQDRLKAQGAEPARAAADFAARLLANDPLHAGALSLYGLAIAQSGAPERAERIMRTAAAHVPFDLASHAWLYERALKAQDRLAAWSHLDMLLRARPGMADRVGASLVSLVGSDPQAEEGFARLMATSPPWRPGLMTYLARHHPDRESLARLFGRLQNSGAPPTLPELQAFLERLAREGDYDRAYLAWVGHLPRERLSKLGLMYNARFQYPVSNLPFDWEFFPAPGMRLRVVADTDEPALKVEFFGARVGFAGVRHFLALAPGDYTLSGMARTDDLQSARGLRWRLYCATGAMVELATTESLNMTTQARPFRVPFSVPEADCGTQVMALESPARIASESAINGSASYWRLDLESRR